MSINKKELIKRLKLVKSVYFTYNNKKTIEELKNIYDIICPLYEDIINKTINTRNFDKNKELKELELLDSIRKINFIKCKFKVKMDLNEGLNRLKFYYKILRNEYPNNKTLVVNLSLIRQIIKKHQTKELYTYSKHDKYFNIPEKERLEIKKYSENKIINNNNKNIQIKKLDIDNFYNKINTELTIKPLMIKLLINSGLRLIGIYKCNIRKHPEKKNVILISNIPKMKDKSHVLERELLYMNNEQFINDHKKLISLSINPISKNNNVSSKYSKLFNRYLKSNLKQYKFINTSFMRKLYIKLLYDKYKDEYDNINIFINKHFGHMNILTSFNYSTIKLI